MGSVTELVHTDIKVRDNSSLGMPEPEAIEGLGALDILTLMIKKYENRLALSVSFGAPEGMVVLDMMHGIDPRSRAFVLDTGRLHPATYELIDRVRDRYGKTVEVVFPNHPDVQHMVARDGMNLFYASLENRKRCCRIRKVEPMRRYVTDLDAYVTGLRRDQNLNRRDTPKIEFDVANGGLVKINPIADWTRDRVMEYVAEHRVPINRLHAEGFPSVGCEPCSRAVGPGESERSGRWWWETDGSQECGLHVADDQEGGLGI